MSTCPTTRITTHIYSPTTPPITISCSSQVHTSFLGLSRLLESARHQSCLLSLEVAMGVKFVGEDPFAGDWFHARRIVNNIPRLMFLMDASSVCLAENHASSLLTTPSPSLGRIYRIDEPFESGDACYCPQEIGRLFHHLHLRSDHRLPPK